QEGCRRALPGALQEGCRRALPGALQEGRAPGGTRREGRRRLVVLGAAGAALSRATQAHESSRDPRRARVLRPQRALVGSRRSFRTGASVSAKARHAARARENSLTARKPWGSIRRVLSSMYSLREISNWTACILCAGRP